MVLIFLKLLADLDAPEQFQNLGIPVPGAAHIASSSSRITLGDIHPSHLPQTSSIINSSKCANNYKSSVMFTWSYQACIKLLPDFNSIVSISIAQFLASRRKRLPNWAPEDHPIQLSSSEGKPIAMWMRLNEGPFRKRFYATVRIFSVVCMC